MNLDVDVDNGTGGNAYVGVDGAPCEMAVVGCGEDSSRWGRDDDDRIEDNECDDSEEFGCIPGEES